MNSFERRFGAKADFGADFKPSFRKSAFSFPKIPVILNENSDKLVLANWCLIPHWVKDSKSAENIRKYTYNARQESIFEKPAYRQSIMHKRCLIPVDGFYEWHQSESLKIPYYITLADNEIFAIAGIWDKWSNPESGEPVTTFSLITTQANPLLLKYIIQTEECRWFWMRLMKMNG